MPRQYIPILIFALLAAAFPGVTLVLFKLIRPDSRNIGAKLKPYECGVPAESDARGRYSVRFYIIAILFVIFDVETIFLFPWAVLFSTREEGFRMSPLLRAGKHVRVSGYFDCRLRLVVPKGRSRVGVSCEVGTFSPVSRQRERPGFFLLRRFFGEAVDAVFERVLESTV